jgi:hypothetical protein
VSTRASYDLKLDRAEAHLVELERAIDRYVQRHPYEIQSRVEGKKQRLGRYFRFTEQPDPIVSVILGDFVYNVRSALDHLRAALVPKSRERNGYFPIHFPGVWEPPVPGESKDRTKQRRSWETETRGMRPEAIAILKQVQIEATSDGDNPGPLVALNRIAMKDRHTKLPVVAAALLNPSGTCRLADGQVLVVRDIAVQEGVPDGAYIHVPEGAVDVNIQGTPAVMVRVSAPDSGIRVPDALRGSILPGSRSVVELLRPYVRADPT